MKNLIRPFIILTSIIIVIISFGFILQASAKGYYSSYSGGYTGSNQSLNNMIIYNEIEASNRERGAEEESNQKRAYLDSVFLNSIAIGQTVKSAQIFYKRNNRLPKDYNELLQSDPQALKAYKSVPGIMNYSKEKEKAVVTYKDNLDKYQRSTNYEVIIGKPPLTASFLELGSTPIPWDINLFINPQVAAVDLESLKMQQASTLESLDLDSLAKPEPSSKEATEINIPWSTIGTVLLYIVSFLILIGILVFVIRYAKKNNLFA